MGKGLVLSTSPAAYPTMTGSSQIAAELAKQQAEVTVAPAQQSLEGLDKGDHQATIQLMIKCAEQRREKSEELVANLGS